MIGSHCNSFNHFKVSSMHHPNPLHVLADPCPQQWKRVCFWYWHTKTSSALPRLHSNSSSVSFLQNKFSKNSFRCCWKTQPSRNPFSTYLSFALQHLRGNVLDQFHGNCFCWQTKWDHLSSPGHLMMVVTAMLCLKLRLSWFSASELHRLPPGRLGHLGWSCSSVQYPFFVQLLNWHWCREDPKVSSFMSITREEKSPHLFFTQSTNCNCNWFHSWNGGWQLEQESTIDLRDRWYVVRLHHEVAAVFTYSLHKGANCEMSYNKASTRQMYPSKSQTWLTRTHFMKQELVPLHSRWPRCISLSSGVCIYHYYTPHLCVCELNNLWHIESLLSLMHKILAQIFQQHENS